MSAEPLIRRAETPADYRACQEAQRRAWGITQDGYVVPVATMVGAQHHGGLVLGAFLPDGGAAALSFAFLGRIEGRICLYSQLTGVVPEYQGRGLGLALKQAQRAFARDEGIGSLAWSFDPLQSGNAHFNLQKLGATAGRFVEDMYGPRTDALNADIPTDRLIAEWSTAEGPGPDASPEGASSWIRVAPDGQGVPSPCGLEFDEAPRVLLEIPDDIKALRRDHPAAADRWRMAVRDGFQHAFWNRYRAVSLVRFADPDGPRRCAYLLERQDMPTLAR